MREIKFRAWDKFENKMYENVQNQYDEFQSFWQVLNQRMPDEDEYDFNEDMEKRFEVMQFTGLHDKAGREIYEGDIVKCIDEINDVEFIAIIEFGNPNCEYTWGYQLKHIRGDKPNLDILCWVDMEETGAFIEVIGNIYENPDLLEGK